MSDLAAPAYMDDQRVHLFAPITKVSEQEDGTVIVEGTFTDETPDDQGERVRHAAVKAALPDFMKWANVREMHDPHSAAGVVLGVTGDEVAKLHTARVHVVDPVAVKKVKTKVYKSFSLGGWKTHIVKAADGITDITGLVMNELSLVDRGSNPNANFAIVKASGDTPRPELVIEVIEDGATSQEKLTMAKTTARIRKNTDTPAATDDQLAATTDQCIPAVITAMTADSAPAEVVAAVVEAVVAAQVTDPLADVVASVTESATTAGASDALVASVTTALTEAHTEATEPEVAPEEVAKRGKLAKSAADSLLALQNVATELAFLAESEGMNGDSDAATRVRAILATVNDAIAAEAAQVGTPEDVAVRAEEIAIDAALNPVTEPVIVVADQMVPVPVVYSAIIGDLAKQGTGLAKGSGKAGVDNSTIQRVHDMTHMAGATCAPTAASLAKVGGAADTSVEDITASVTAALEPLAKASDVATMKAELLGTLGTLREGLAEIGKRAAPGGPAKYGTVRQAMDKASDAAGDEPGARAAWLDAEAAAATDPNIKAYLSKASAQAKTASLLGSR